MHFTQVHHTTPVSAELEGLIRRMPKVELHVHLEGATDPDATFDMARRNGLALPVLTREAWRAFYTFRDFNHFIDVYLLVAGAMQKPDDYVSMVESYMRTQAEQGIVYSEVFFSPLLHRQKFPMGVVLDALSEGVRRGAERWGTRVRFIPDVSREMSRTDPALQRYVLDFALEARDRGIGVGFGLAGKEIGHPPEAFTEIFAEARRAGLNVVAHGGETGGPDSVRGALTALQAQRIGHGVRAVEDPTLVEALCRAQVPLEVSPQSNYCLGVVAHDAPHPIRQLVDAGVTCTVNTDDPPFFATDLSNEYLTLAAQGFSFAELWQLNLNAVKAAFLTEAEKADLFCRWEAFAQQVPAAFWAEA